VIPDEVKEILKECVPYIKSAAYDAEVRFDNSDDDGAFYYDMREAQALLDRIEGLEL